MGAYQYHALKKSGTFTKGLIEADNERQARHILRERGLIPTEIKIIKKNNFSKHKERISSQDLCLMTRQLATLLAAGIPVEESLRGLSEQTEKTKVRQLIMGVRAKVTEGYALAQAMSEYPLAFPELYRATVAAGEQTGRLDFVLDKLADYTEKQQVVRQKVQQALIYPSIMIFISIAIVSFLLAFVVPKIIEVFTSGGQAMPTMTVILISISHFTQHYGVYVLLLILLSIFAITKSLKNPRIQLYWHRIVLKIPIGSYLIRSVNVARYIHTFAILFAAGVGVLETMRVSTNLLSNISMRHAFELATTQVKEGSPISQSLQKTSYLSPMAIHLIASGEKSGKLPSMMERAALYLDDEVKRLIDTALTLLEPFVILVMGAVVLFIVLATLLPIFSMQQLI